MGTVIGAAIDYLVNGLPGVLTPIDPIVYVADNEPAYQTQSLVVVGRQGPQSGVAANGADEYRELGAARLDEAWSLDLYIQCFRPGPAQKPARDAVLALYDGLIKFLHSDPTLDGIVLMGRYAQVGRTQLTQTQDDADTGTSGDLRMAQISLEIAIPNTYIPS